MDRLLDEINKSQSILATLKATRIRMIESYKNQGFKYNEKIEDLGKRMSVALCYSFTSNFSNANSVRVNYNRVGKCTKYYGDDEPDTFVLVELVDILTLFDEYQQNKLWMSIVYKNKTKLGLKEFSDYLKTIEPIHVFNLINEYGVYKNPLTLVSIAEFKIENMVILAL